MSKGTGHLDPHWREAGAWFGCDKQTPKKHQTCVCGKCLLLCNAQVL